MTQRSENSFSPYPSQRAARTSSLVTRANLFKPFRLYEKRNGGNNIIAPILY